MARAPAMPGTPDLELQSITKSFENGTVAVDDLSLDIRAGELVSLLGPSGCGKTTTLRIIAGFVAPDAGRVVIRGADVTERPPNKRDTGMVFQSYALFPHMSVERNIAYGLRMRGLDRGEVRRRVDEVLDLVRLRELARWYPRQLSGGQQQRVALARALVIRPSLLLLDEPLSNLDAKLRQQMRGEILHLQRHLGISTMLVTHDQEEALTLSDRIVVMNRGHIEQVGSARSVYRQPRSRFVAEFIGDGNFIEGVAGPWTEHGPVVVTDGGLQFLVAHADHWPEGERLLVGVRPESIGITPAGSPTMPAMSNRCAAVVEEVVFTGPFTTFRLRLDDRTAMRALRQNSAAAQVDGAGAYAVGTTVTLSWPADACYVVPRAVGPT